MAQAFGVAQGPMSQAARLSDEIAISHDSGGKVTDIFIVRNPEKLARLETAAPLPYQG